MREVQGNGMAKKLIQNRKQQFFRQATPTSNYSSTAGVFRFKITLSVCDKQKQELIHCPYLLCGHYMAVRVPGHDDLNALLLTPRMALSLAIWEPTV